MITHHEDIESLLRLIRMSSTLNLSDHTHQRLLWKLSDCVGVRGLDAMEEASARGEEVGEGEVRRYGGNGGGGRVSARSGAEERTAERAHGAVSGQNIRSQPQQTVGAIEGGGARHGSGASYRSGVVVSGSLEKLMSEGADWSELCQVLQRRWYEDPCLKNACQITEITYLWAGVQGVCEVLLWFHDFSFWRQLHHAVREHLVMELARSEILSSVIKHLGEHVFSEWLIPVERLVVFIHASVQKQYGLIFKMHGKYGRELALTVKKVGLSLGMSFGQFQYVVGRGRMEKGYYEEALAMIRSISPSDMAYQPAAKLKKAIYLKKKNSSSSRFHSQVMAHVLSQSDWREREKALRYYLDQVRQEHPHCAQIVPVLNELLARESFYPIERAGALSQFAALCLEYVDMYEKIPNILGIFSCYANRFLAPALDTAIWGHFLGKDLPRFACELWRAVALFHRFVLMGAEAQEDLVEAYEGFMQQPQDLAYVVDFCFEDLKKAALVYWRDSSLHAAAAVEEMRALLELCRGDVRLEASHMEGYLRAMRHPRYLTLRRLYAVCGERGYKDLGGRVVDALIAHGYLRNDFLSAYLHQSIHRQDHDLAWRVMTVLRWRTIEFAAWEPLWKVSGENRTFYHATDVGMEDVSKYLQGRWHPHARKMFYALLSCGYKIPQLVAISSYRHHVVRWKRPPADSREEEILQEMESYSWLQRPSRRVSRRTVHDYAPLGIPLLESSAGPLHVSTRYAMMASYVLECMGILSFDAQFSSLEALASLTAPLPQGEVVHNPTQKAAHRWLRSLTEEERVAWIDLCSLVQKMPSSEVCLQVMMMVFALVVLMIPSHQDALGTVQSISLSCTRDLERFLLSAEYSAFRRHYGLASKVPTTSLMTKHS